MTNPFDDDDVITRIVRNPFDFGSTYIKLTYGKEEDDSYVLNKDSDNELKKYLKIFLVLATSVAEKQILGDKEKKNLENKGLPQAEEKKNLENKGLPQAEEKNILNHNLEFLYSDENPTNINIGKFTKFVEGLCSKVEETIQEPPAEITDAVEAEGAGESCPTLPDLKKANKEVLKKINSSCINKNMKKIILQCIQEPDLAVCEFSDYKNYYNAAAAAGGGRKIKTQKGKKSRNANKSKNKISRKHRTKKNSQKGGASKLTLPPPPPKVIKVAQRVEQRVEERIEEVLPPGASVRKNNYTVDGVRLPLYCINIDDIPERNRRIAPASIYSNFMDLGYKFVSKNTCCVYRRNFNLTEWKFNEKEGEGRICMNEALDKYGTCPQHTCFNCGFPKYRHSKYCDFCILGSSGGFEHVDGSASRFLKDRYPFCDTLRHTQGYYREIRNNLQYYINTKKKTFTVSTSSLPAPPPKNPITSLPPPPPKNPITSLPPPPPSSLLPPLPAPPGRGVFAGINTPGQVLFGKLNRMPIGEGICKREGRGGVTCTYNNLKGYKYCNMHTCSLNLLGEGGKIGGEIFRCSEVKASTDKYCAAHEKALDRRNDTRHVQDVFSTFKHYEGLHLSQFLRSEAVSKKVTGPEVQNLLTLEKFRKVSESEGYTGDVETKAKDLFEFCFPGATVPTVGSPEYEAPPISRGLPDPGKLFEGQQPPEGPSDSAAGSSIQVLSEKEKKRMKLFGDDGHYFLAEHKEGQGPSRKAPPPPIRKVDDNYFIIRNNLYKYIPGENVRHEFNILNSLKDKLEFYTNNGKELSEILLLPEIEGEPEKLKITEGVGISPMDKAVRNFMGNKSDNYTRLKYKTNFLDKSKFISLDEIIQRRDDGILAKFFTSPFNAFDYISANPTFYLQFKYRDQPFQNIKLFIILLLVIMRKLYQASLFVHGNLNASNIMISLSDPKFYIINFEYSAIINNSGIPIDDESQLGNVSLIHSHLTEYQGFKEIFDYLAIERENVGVSYFTDVEVKIGDTLGAVYLISDAELKKIAFKNYVIHLTDAYLILFGNQGRHQGDITIFNEILENIHCFLIRTISTATEPKTFSKDPVFTKEMMDTFMESHRVSEPYISQNVIYAAFLCFANRY